ncbi:hypothetical protein Taro_019738 [Colocasia esculenta]|uniref:Uncharacterized protein n=1 Tax=Colocasia esculenta TaxID=4460 RepID=A0A843UUB3_COLES|nr:hypothetical protein [Colocasia esculenta]
MAQSATWREPPLEPVGATSRIRALPKLEQEKNSEVKRDQLEVVPGWVTFPGSLPTSMVVGPVC